MNFKAKDIVVQGLIAAIYFAITMLTYYFSFLGIQFRIAEMLMVLVFFNKKYAIGLTLGCVLANFTSSIGPIDALCGGLATISACLVLCFSKYLAPALLFTVAVNGFVVAAELLFIFNEPFWLSVGLVSAGEATVLLVAYIIVLLLRKKKNFFRLFFFWHDF